MIEDAAREGIDLKDPAVMRMMEMAESEMKNKGKGDMPPPTLDSQSHSGGDTALDIASMKDIVSSMNEDEAKGFLRHMEVAEKEICNCSDLPSLRDRARLELDALMVPQRRRQYQMPSWKIGLLCTVVTM
jgi:hypothetical protein